MERRYDVWKRSAPAIEAPHHHGVNLPATGGLQEKFTLRTVLGTGADLVNFALKEGTEHVRISLMIDAL